MPEAISTLAASQSLSSPSPPPLPPRESTTPTLRRKKRGISRTGSTGSAGWSSESIGGSAPASPTREHLTETESERKPSIQEDKIEKDGDIRESTASSESRSGSSMQTANDAGKSQKRNTLPLDLPGVQPGSLDKSPTSTTTNSPTTNSHPPIPLRHSTNGKAFSRVPLPTNTANSSPESRIPLSPSDPHPDHSLPIPVSRNPTPPLPEVTPADEKIPLSPTTTSPLITLEACTGYPASEEGTLTPLRKYQHHTPQSPSAFSTPKFNGKLWSDWSWHRHGHESRGSKEGFVGGGEGGGGSGGGNGSGGIGGMMTRLKEKLDGFGKAVYASTHYGGGEGGRGRRSRETNVGFE
ncbi:hypothetical protein BDZ91DRAFT_850280 [Kalaharituber pfeilii]|nr:hypothetical protein BDZ91DRAFT_850280 [Kalaharituber pfeilii]